MTSSRSLVLVNILAFLAVSTFALQCGTNTCPAGNSCCNDVLMGPTCYDEGQAVCASTGVQSSSGESTSRLCGFAQAACNTVCYVPADYFCCNGQLQQKGQACASAPTAAPTSAPTSSPTSAPTAAPTEVPTAAPTNAPVNNCPAAANQPGVNCAEGTTCCGAGTMTPSCLPADGSKQCCRWYLSSTQCDADEICGGGLGPGASSYAYCGAPGTTFCNQGLGVNTFCNSSQVCCGQYGQYAQCCDATAAPTDAPTAAPTDAPTAAPTDAPTAAPTEAPTSPPTSAPLVHNCPAAGGAAGVNCSEGTTCCGAGTMTPSCLPADGSKQCCTWYLSSTQCDPDQVCGGSYGYGASSYAQCGPAGTTLCNKGDGYNSFCAQDKPLCCGNYGQYSFCCAANCACNNTMLTCDC